MRRTLAATLAAAVLSLTVAAAPAPAPAAADPVHALRQFGEPEFGPDFTHFPHVNPDAPKGGEIIIGSNFPATFDSLNTVILRGVKPRHMGLIADPLMVGSGWELDAAYGRLAESVAVAEDRSEAVFTLRPEARWHDGTPITAGDLVFAWDAIQEHGSPFLKSFLDKITAVEAPDDRRLRIALSSRGEIKPIIDFATTLSPLPRHWWTAEGRDISRTSLEAPLGSGPYRVAAVDPGRSITFRRVEDYWGRDLAVNRGQYNFDTVRVDYYRDDDVMFEAFKAGAYDVRMENRAQRWTTGYDFPAARDGRVVRREIARELPLGAQAFRFNTRRERFADPRVREAFGYLFDFEWIQRNILYGQYTRTKSNFPNSEYGARDLPGPHELELLEPFRDRVPPRVFTDPYEPPVTDGSGRSRENLREAFRLFAEAGWELRDGRMINTATGARMTVEFLESGGLTRVIQPYVEALRRAGVDAQLRIVDTAQYQRRTDEFDFDVVVTNFAFPSPPGTELYNYFGSQAADTPGSANLAGIRDPVVDALIGKVVEANDRDSLLGATRALDRVLLWSHYMVPHWYNADNWVAMWDKFGTPDTDAPYDDSLRAVFYSPAWWSKRAQGQ
ncbi:extracellular solute-binding protein [Azospirillum halopraeferens]|uniref:extracellular solute-binding protein n=1 Tax=Azospirillum halopraeferens TaxID=34010 RepID=UPI0003FF9B89|nr:extracellular solute-binding protein [Azospirillum halopraeferens]